MQSPFSESNHVTCIRIVYTIKYKCSLELEWENALNKIYLNEKKMKNVVKAHCFNI